MAAGKVPGDTAAGIWGWGSREGPSGLAGDPHLILVILAGALGAASALGLVEISPTAPFAGKRDPAEQHRRGRARA